MTDTPWLSGKKLRLAGCLLAGVSVASASVIDKALAHAELPSLMRTLPIAAAVGLAAGCLYYLVLRFVLPRLERRQGDELWAGLNWFNLCTLSLWLAILPLPAAYIDFGIGFVFSGGCARLASSVYVVFGASLSNRKRFANTFVMLALTIMLVITVVKASLALSLGLVGALSIIRFRTAIKEPEELAFLFFTVAIGLGFGAGRFGITLTAFWAISVGFILFRRIQSAKHMENAFLVTMYGPGKDFLSSMSRFLEEHGLAYEFTRLETGDAANHVSFLVEIDSAGTLEALNDHFRERYPEANMTMVQARSLI
jgi:hypothetical protein